MVGESTVTLRQALEQGRAMADSALERLLPPADTAPVSIHRAMRHSTFAGGKRLRPVLAYEAARMFAAELLAGAEARLPPGAEARMPPGVDELGAALEMLHTYSLIHDDLPALDNDDLRRGKPTCHVVYGEDIAILAGDALQTQAYEVLAGLQCEPARIVAIVREVAGRTGTCGGMIGGQVMDLESESVAPTAPLVEAIHRAKTGALITACVVTGGIYAGATANDVQHLRGFGERAGLAFQIMDDVLDVTQPSETLGKTAGKDTATEKATWPAVFGVEQSRRDAARLVEEAFAQLDGFGGRADTLKALARYVVERTN